MNLEFEKIHILGSKSQAHRDSNLYVKGLGEDPTFVTMDEIPGIIKFCQEKHLGMAVTNSEKRGLPVWVYKKNDREI